MATYRAIQVASDGSLQPTRRELVGPSAGHVRIKVEACGVCHSDTASVHPHPATEAGVVPGHEAVGRIDAIGDGVTGWSVGDRVGVGFLGGHCGVCAQCRRGNFTACTDQPVTGRTTDGGYAEYLYARQSGLVAIPAPLSSVAAAPLLCAGFTTCNALLKAPLRPGGLVAVQGIGGLGHLGLQYARKMGANVVAIARGTAKAGLSRHLGAHHYIDAAATDVGAELTKLGGADIILATAASGASMTALIPGLAYGGQLMVVGASGEPIGVSPLALIFGGVTVTGSLTGSSIENEDNLRFAVQQGISAMIEEASLDDAPAAYARMMSGAARFRMVLNIA
jgi:alcohol dehydrogenase, propanol-preferring